MKTANFTKMPEVTKMPSNHINSGFRMQENTAYTMSIECDDSQEWESIHHMAHMLSLQSSVKNLKSHIPARRYRIISGFYWNSPCGILNPMINLCLPTWTKHVKSCITWWSYNLPTSPLNPWWACLKHTANLHTYSVVKILSDPTLKTWGRTF